jgi:hypothetical protein
MVEEIITFTFLMVKFVSTLKFISQEGMQWKRVQCSASLSCKEPEYSSRYEHSMSICNEKSRAYMFGGRSGRAKTPLNDKNLYALYLDTFTWEKVPVRDVSPSARYGHATCVHGKKLFLFGGVGKDGSLLDDMWIFDSDLHVWEDYTTYHQSRQSKDLTITIQDSPVRKTPEPRWSHQICAINGFVYVIGGLGKNVKHKDIWCMNIHTGDWTEIEISQHKELIPYAHSGNTIVGKKILLYGGNIDDSNYLRHVLIFDTVSNKIIPMSLATAEHHGVGLSRHSLVLFGLHLISIGGKIHYPSYFSSAKYAEEMYQYYLGIKITPPKNLFVCLNLI